MLIQLPGGLILPIEYVIGLLIAIILIPIFLAIVFLRGGDKSPIEENMALIVPVDTNKTLQVAQLVGNVKQMEDELIVTNPDWVDEEDNDYTAIVPKERKMKRMRAKFKDSPSIPESCREARLPRRCRRLG